MALAISSDNRFFISASMDGSVRVYDIYEKFQSRHLPDIHKGNIPFIFLLLNVIGSVLSVSASARFFVTVSDDKSMKVFNLETMEEVHHIVDTNSGIILQDLFML